MHSFPAGQRDETHAAPSLLEHPAGGSRTAARAATRATHRRRRERGGAGSMDDEARRRYASCGVGPRAAISAMRTIREAGARGRGGAVRGLATVAVLLVACGDSGDLPATQTNKASSTGGDAATQAPGVDASGDALLS